MESPYHVKLSAQRPATKEEKLSMGADSVTDEFSDRVRAYDRNDAAGKGKKLALKKWPKAKGWQNHSAVVV